MRFARRRRDHAEAISDDRQAGLDDFADVRHSGGGGSYIFLAASASAKNTGSGPPGSPAKESRSHKWVPFSNVRYAQIIGHRGFEVEIPAVNAGPRFRALVRAGVPGPDQLLPHLSPTPCPRSYRHGVTTFGNVVIDLAPSGEYATIRFTRLTHDLLAWSRRASSTDNVSIMRSSSTDGRSRWLGGKASTERPAPDGNSPSA